MKTPTHIKEEIKFMRRLNYHWAARKIQTCWRAYIHKKFYHLYKKTVLYTLYLKQTTSGSEIAWNRDQLYEWL